MDHSASKKAIFTIKIRLGVEWGLNNSSEARFTLAHM